MSNPGIMRFFRTNAAPRWAYTCFLLTAAGAGVSAWAQRDSLSMDVTFIGDREMMLRDAHKILAWPEAAALPVGKPQFTYNLLAKRLLVSPTWEPVEARRLDVQRPLPLLYRGYVQAGFGRFATPYLQASVTDLRSKRGTWGTGVNHFSTRGGMAEADSLPQTFSETGFDLWGKRFLRDAHVVSAEGSVGRHRVGYYGLAADSVFAAAEPGSERFTQLGTTVRWSRWEADSTELQHDAALSYRYLAVTEGTRENNLNFTGQVRTFREGEQLELGWGANYDLRSYAGLDSGTTVQDRQLVLRLSPALVTHRGPITAKVGAHINLDARGQQVFHFNPVAEAQLNVLKGLFVPYLRLTGGVDQNRLETVWEQNPWVRPDLALRNTYRKWDLEGGLTGHFARNVHYRGRASFTRYEQYLYFVNDSLLDKGLRFNGLYGDLSVFTLGGELDMPLGTTLHLTGGLDIHQYGTGDQPEAWNLPVLEWRAEAKYTHRDVLKVQAGLAYQSLRKGVSYVPMVEGSVLPATAGQPQLFTQELGAFLDANLSVEYLFNKRMSTWMRLANVAGARYAVWTGYPVQRFQAMLGFSYAF